MQGLVDSFIFVATTLVPAIVIDVTLANIAVELGILGYISAATRPITRAAHLPNEAVSAVLPCLASPAAGYSMLAEFRERGSLDDRQILIAVVINTFPGAFSHLFSHYVPVVIPILGLDAGLLYVGARLVMALSITLTGIIMGKALLPDPGGFGESSDGDTRGSGTAYRTPTDCSGRYFYGWSSPTWRSRS